MVRLPSCSTLILTLTLTLTLTLIRQVSTVTYLTDFGAPTMVLNQTTPDGNSEVE